MLNNINPIMLRGEHDQKEFYMFTKSRCEMIRCDVCGRFIPFKDLHDGTALYREIYPDSELTVETWEGLCKDHYKKENKMEKRKVYDEVWIMSNNKPTEKMIFSVLECMNHAKDGTSVYYGLVDGTFGAGLGNNEGKLTSETNVYSSKEDLLDSL